MFHLAKCKETTVTRGVATGRPEDGGGHGPSTSISEPNKVQKFQFQKSEILLFTDDVQKLFLQFLPCMLQFLDNLFFLTT